MSIKDIWLEFYYNVLQPDIQDRQEYLSDKPIIFRRHYRSRYDLMKHIPQIAGFLFGCAVARLFECGFSGYIIFGIIFCAVIGTFKSYLFDRYPFWQSLRMNIVHTLCICGLFGIIMLITKYI